MIFVSIEGNIGSGKSTVMKYLKQYFGNEKRIVFLEEPVDSWMHITDKNGKNMLEKYYADTKNYAFAFQMMAYISRISQIKNILESSSADIIVSERSVHTDKNVFAKMLYDSELLEDVEYKIYLNWFNEFIKDIPQSYAFYIKTDPEVAFERVQKRARPGETCSLDYLSSCHLYHNNWLLPSKSNSVVKLFKEDFINEYSFKNWLHSIYYNDSKIENENNRLAVLEIDGNIDIHEENNAFEIISNAINILLKVRLFQKNIQTNNIYSNNDVKHFNNDVKYLKYNNKNHFKNGLIIGCIAGVSLGVFTSIGFDIISLLKIY
jgi:deoxyadenosine/deoxycytidine kinase